MQAPQKIGMIFGGYNWRICFLVPILAFLGCYKPIPRPSNEINSTGNTTSVLTLNANKNVLSYKGTTNTGVLGFLSVWEFDYTGGKCTVQVTSAIRPSIGLRQISFKPYPSDSINVSIIKNGNIYAVTRGRVLVQDAGLGGRKYVFTDLLFTFRSKLEKYPNPEEPMQSGAIDATLQER
jgi:hypothetical protein